MTTSLIITTYNRPDALELVLESVLLQSQLPDEVIIADDGSKEDTRKVIQKFKANASIPVIHSWQEDLGFRAARSRNLAIAQSKKDYLILLDGDMVLHRKFIDSHIKHAQEGFFLQGGRTLVKESATQSLLENLNQPKFSVFSKEIKNKLNSLHSYFLSNFFSRKKQSLKGTRTCNFSLWKKDLIAVNGFNEKIQGWGREDTEMVVRLMNNNIQRKNLKFCGIAYHLYHQAEGKSALKRNHEILEQAIQEKLNWCEAGINRHL